MADMRLMLLTCACALVASAEVTPASVFNSGMVLQREMPVRVWGRAAAGEKVTVTYACGPITHRAEATADAKGAWRTELAPLVASKTPGTLTFKASNEIVYSDVLVGEVWFVCGQSNTELPFCGTNPHFRDAYGATTAQTLNKRCVRFAYTSNYRWSATPKDAFAQRVAWQEFTAANLTGGHSFSAMGVWYALELYSALEIPVAVIGSYWGGTNIDAWTPREGTATRADLKDILAWKTVAANVWTNTCAKGPISGPQQQPAVLWNEQVAPWCPFAMRGFIWYQGCHNAGEWQRYASKMHALYNGWSLKFENPNLKLYFVQLAPWGNPGIAYIQEAQAQFEREEKNAGMAVINDHGNLRDIHPNQKYIVGKRLALHALKRDYGFTAVRDNSPTLARWKIEGNAFVLDFNDADAWYVYNPDWSAKVGFEVAGADGRFVPAKLLNLVPDAKNPAQSRGHVKGATLRVAAEGVAEPRKLRYLYSKPWYGCLYNEAGLPLGAFHIGE